MLVPDWLDLGEQRRLVEACRDGRAGRCRCGPRACPPGTRCRCRPCAWAGTGRPYRYSRIAGDAGGGRVLPGAGVAGAVGKTCRRRRLRRSGCGCPYEPDAALINFYDDAARMGMHRDQEERADAPVVSLSNRRPCTFRFGNPDTRT
ncbi:alpha-ketoglutarate-dependent dioxygenase AlkB, partial [Rhodococcus hoagii]|nr:alpha-ketoglutarate-dependent dioxygenase AlkB [Prescottella equi]